jgi:hypothetical protein
MDPDYFSYPPISLIIISVALLIALAVGNGFIARALNKSVVLWVVLSLIPFINTFFYIYMVYAVVLGILHRLNSLTSRSGVVIDT